MYWKLSSIALKVRPDGPFPTFPQRDAPILNGNIYLHRRSPHGWSVIHDYKLPMTARGLLFGAAVLLMSMRPIDIAEVFELLDREGNVVTLEAWHGYYVVMEVWKPDEAPRHGANERVFQWIYRRSADRHYPFSRGVRFVRCALTPDFEQWRRYIQLYGLDFAVEVVDTSVDRSPLLRQLGARRFPYYVVYNQMGEILYQGDRPRAVVRTLRKASRKK